MPRRALARKISYKDARSYRRTVPNPMGVTAIASVNRSKTYARRYNTARSILAGKRSTRRNRAPAAGGRTLKQLADDMRRKGMSEERIRYSVAGSARARGMTEAEIRKEGFDPAKLPGKFGAAAGKKTAAKAAKKETKVARKTRKKAKKKVARKKVARKKVARKRKPAKRKVARKKVARKRKPAKRKVARKKVARKRKPAKRKVARKKVAKKLTPEQRKAKAMKKCLADERKAARALRKVEQRKKRLRKASADARKRRARTKKAAAKMKRRQAKPRMYPLGKSQVWAPTVRITPANVKDAYVYQSRAGTLRKVPIHSLAGYATKAQMKKAITGNSPEAVAERERIALLYKRIQTRRDKAADRMRKRGGIFTPNRRRGRGQTRALTYEEWESMKSNKRRRRRKRRKTRRKSYTRNLTARQRAALAKGRRMAARRRKPVRRNRVTQAAANKPRRRRRRKAYRRPRTTYRRYRRNQALAGSYQNQLMQALKLGGVITAGYLVHRALTKVVQQSVFADTQYGELISGALVAAVGVPLSVKVAPGDSKLVGAGMMVSLVHSGIMALLRAVDTNGTLSAYLSGFGSSYGNRPGSMLSGMGSYYQFYPRQQMGEYFQTAGLGQYQQAAAGMGQMMQAAAGMGQLTQAAAGAGEYLAVGAEGIGEYEEVTPEYTRPIPVDEGISPDLSTAEQALSVAEAAAGVGGAPGYQGVPAVSWVNPGGFATPIKDAPGGSRAGVFAGKGVFGPTS
jgi:hypothetical protein